MMCGLMAILRPWQCARSQAVSNSLAQRFRTERREQGVTCRICFGPEQCAEAAWIVETDHGAGSGDQVEVVMPARGRWIVQHAQAAGHAQMQERGTAVSAEEQVLGPSLHGQHFGARQAFGQVSRNRPAQCANPGHEARDALPFEPGRDAAPGGFYLG